MNRYPLDGAALNGWQTFYASGSAAMTLATVAGGVVAQRGAGSTALAMAAQGNGIQDSAVRGTAALALAASGTSKRAAVAGAVVSLAMRAAAVSASVQRGSAQAPLRLAASHGLPQPPVIAGPVIAAHPKAVLTVPPESATLLVPADATTRVRAAQQLVPVDPNRNL